MGTTWWGEGKEEGKEKGIFLFMATVKFEFSPPC